MAKLSAQKADLEAQLDEGRSTLERAERERGGVAESKRVAERELGGVKQDVQASFQYLTKVIAASSAAFRTA